MPTSTSEETLLRRAITTMLSQICKVGVSYANELSIEGTIGVTVDQHHVFVVHFDDRIIQSIEDQSNDSVAMAPPSTIVSSEQEVWTSPPDPQQRDDISQTFSSLLTAEPTNNIMPVSSTILIPNPPVIEGVSSSAKMMNCFQTSSGISSRGHIGRDQTLNERVAIDIDSDSYEGFPFVELTGETVTSEALVSPQPSVTSMCGDGDRKFEEEGMEFRVPGKKKKKNGKRGRGRNVIVIEDNDIFAAEAEAEADVLDEAESDLIDSSDFKSFNNINQSYYQDPNIQYVNQAQIPPTLNISQPIRSVDINRTAVIGGLKKKLNASLMEAKRSQVSSLGTRHTCDICLRPHRSVSLLESHLVSAHNIVEHCRLGRIAHFSCSRCQRRFRFRAQLDKHSLGCAAGNTAGMGISMRPHRCARCRNAYRHADSLRLHARTHDARFLGAMLHCDICAKTYANRVLFQKHIVYKHERLRVGTYVDSGE